MEIVKKYIPYLLLALMLVFMAKSCTKNHQIKYLKTIVEDTVKFEKTIIDSLEGVISERDTYIISLENRHAIDSVKIENLEKQKPTVINNSYTRIYQSKDTAAKN